MSWCDVTLCRSRPERSARGRAALNATRRRGRAFQCLIAQCLMSGDHATFTSPSNLCPRRAYKRLYKTKPHEPLGAVRPGRRPAGAWGRAIPEARIRRPRPRNKRNSMAKRFGRDRLCRTGVTMLAQDRGTRVASLCAARKDVCKAGNPSRTLTVVSVRRRVGSKTPPPFLPPPPFPANPSGGGLTTDQGAAPG